MVIQCVTCRVMTSLAKDSEWDTRASVSNAFLADNESMFRQLFDRSADAIFLFDPGREVFVDCNRAAVEMMGATSKQELLMVHPANLSPEFQPDGQTSREKTPQVISLALNNGSHRFEWRARRMDGTEFPLEVLLTPIQTGECPLMATVCRDITGRKRAEQKILELNASLEQRVAERTAALRESEAKFRALFEGSSQGVVLHDEQQILEVNPAAVRIMGRQSPQELIGKHPSAIAPPFQRNGERSDVMAARYISECMTRDSARFEWLARGADGNDIPLEVGLTRIEWSGRQVIQAFITDITARTRAQAALAESEARFSAVFHVSPVFIALGQPDNGRFVLLNDAFVNWSGYSREEIIGRNALELGMWEFPEEREAFWSDLRRRGSLRGRECRFRNRAGRRFMLLVSADLIQLNDAPHMLFMGLDITESKRAQAALAESEARFSAAFHASPAFISIIRMSDGQYVLANDAFLNFVSQRIEDIVGRTCADLGIWEDPAEHNSALQDMATLGTIRHREFRWRNPRGERFTILFSAETIKVNDTPHFLVMALDITQRKRAEEELRASEARLRESEARFSAAFHSSPIITGICRASDRKFVLVNDAALNWAGYSRDEVIGHTSIELSIWENPEERERMWDDALRSRSVRGRECRLRNGHGRLSTMLASGAMIEINGEDHLLVMMVDINQRKQAEAELHRTLAREKELSQLRSNFVSMVSHEFRTPLGIIQSSAELLRDFRQRMRPHEQEEQLNAIARNTRRMAGLMEEVLVLSRLDAGKLDFQPGKMDLNIFCGRVVDEILSATSRRCHVKLFMNSIPAEAQADERLLGHIFTNVLSNAIKYSEAGATVEFSVAREGRDAVCTIRDRGIGISEADQQQLFEAFHRGGNVGTRPGTGLGLLLVKRCADLHGGTVRVSSKVGEGTTVTVRLPLF